MSSNPPDDLLAYIRASEIGADLSVQTPFGDRRVLYADYTASGRALTFIEDYIRQQVLPTYGNTHTNSTRTGQQTSEFVDEARTLIKTALKANKNDRVLFPGAGATSCVHQLVAMLGLTRPSSVALPPSSSSSSSSPPPTSLSPSSLHLLPEGEASSSSSPLSASASPSAQPVVFVGPYEHHSNLLPWRESIARVVPIRESSNGGGGPDLHHLEEGLKRYSSQGAVLMVGAFSLASNVTGTLTHSNAVTKLLHMYGAFAVWDGASAAPHAVEGMAMNPMQQLQQPRSRQQKQQQQQEQQQQQQPPPLQPLSSVADKQEVDNKNEDQEEVEEDEEELWGVGDAKLFEKDALFFSPHKFPGGPQAVGVLVVKKALLRMMNNNSVNCCRDASCASKHETTTQKSDQQRSRVWRWGINNNGGLTSSSSSSSEQHQVKNGIGAGISSAGVGDGAGVGVGVGDGGAVVDFKGRGQSSTAGGGTVFFVGPSSHVYARNDEEREQGGTLPIVGAIRAGLCMQLQTAVGASVIGAADAYIVEQVRLKWAHHPNIVLLGPSPRPSPSSRGGGGGHGGGGGGTNAPRVPVFALLVRVPTTTTTTTATSSTVTTSTTTTTAPPTPPLLFLHHNAVVAMLNDLFGVQCRGGCMCAGPYSQQLLGIDQKLSDDFMTELTKKEDNEVLRPGYFRVSLPYFVDIETLNYVLDAVVFVAEHGFKLLPLYTCDAATGEWVHVHMRRRNQVGGSGGTIGGGSSGGDGDGSGGGKQKEERKWLGAIDYSSGRMQWGRSGSAGNGGGGSSGSSASASEQQTTRFSEAFAQAQAAVRVATAELARNTFQEGRGGGGGGGGGGEMLSPEAARLRWFILPSEAAAVMRRTSRSSTNGNDSVTSPLLLPSSSSPPSSSSSLLLMLNQSSPFQPPCLLARDRERKRAEEESAAAAEGASRTAVAAAAVTDSKAETAVEEAAAAAAAVGAHTTELEAAATVAAEAEAVAMSFQELAMGPQEDEEEKSSLSFESKETNKEGGENIKGGGGSGGGWWKSPSKQMMNQVVKAVQQHGMLRPGDRLLLGLSGGKDSLALLHTLKALQQRTPFEWEFGCCTVDPQASGFDPSPLKAYLKVLGVPYFYEEAPLLEMADDCMAATKGNRPSICSFCSRMKRGLLYGCAKREKYNVLALAHHVDDLAESFVMSALHNGALRSMKAHYVIAAESGLRVVRPLAYIRERALEAFADDACLPVVSETCPACFTAPKERFRVKALLASQESLHPTLFSSLLRTLLPLMEPEVEAFLKTRREAFGGGGNGSSSKAGAVPPPLVLPQRLQPQHQNQPEPQLQPPSQGSSPPPPTPPQPTLPLRQPPTSMATSRLSPAWQASLELSHHRTPVDIKTGSSMVVVTGGSNSDAHATSGAKPNATATTNAMTAAATITTATPPAFIATNRDDVGNTEYSRGLNGEDAGTSPSSSFSYSGEVVPLSSTQALNRFLKDATTRKGLVCVVAFSSPGCGPCKRLAGPMSKLAQELKEVALFVSVDVTENNNGGDNEEEDDDENGSRPLADVCGVSAVPTFQLYRPVTTHPSSSGSGSGEGAVCEGRNLPVPASTLVATKALELRGAECWKVRATIEKLLK